MCADGYESDKTPVGECRECGSEIDEYGYTTEWICNYAYETCESCGYSPCDESC